MKKLVLIDSNALVHRAFHALPPTLSSPKGFLTNAVYGYTTILLKMIKDLQPDYIAATFDLAGPTFRHKEFEDYKAHREKAPDELYAQIPLTKEILKSFGIPIYEKQGFEADDLIGALAEKAKNEPLSEDLQIIITTGDLDTLQLVDGKKVVVFTLRKGINDTIIYDEDEVIKRYGLKPNQVTDFKGLKGDPSDNIPGVPGVGEKTASSLVQAYGNIENLYLELEKSPKSQKISPRLIEKLIENKDQAFFSKKLATIIRDVDIDFDLEKANWKNNANRAEVEIIFKEFGFFSLIKRMDEFFSTDPDKATSEKSETTETKEDTIAKTKKSILGAIKTLSQSESITFDVRDGIFLFTPDNKKCLGFNLDDITISNIGSEAPWNDFAAAFNNPKIKKQGHDLKPILKKFLQKDIHVKGLDFDTKIAAYLLKSDRKDYELKQLYFNELNKDLPARPAEQILAIAELSEHLKLKLEKGGLSKVMYEIEVPLLPVLAEVELAGIKIDLASLKKLSKSVSTSLENLEQEIFKHAEIEFNINSPKQLKEIIFEKLGLKGKVRKTAKGALSTAAGELEKLVGEHPIIDLILKYRELQKLKTTYIEPFPQLLDPRTTRIYTTLNQTGTVTGRISSQDPNLQNIPVKTELGQEFRKSFIAENGYQLVSFDYSQLELRIAAHMSEDAKMISAFNRGEDIHTRTAAEVFEIAPENVTANMRREAKTLNFGLLYGMGLMGFQRAAGVSRDRAREFIDRYMTEFNGVAQYMDSMRLKARRDGYVETIFGRKRFLPEIKSGIPQLIAQAERMAINMPIQGTEGDLLRIAMSRISDLIHQDYNDRDIRMLLQVHDELLFEIKKNLISEISPKIKKIMENICQLKVPLTIDVKVGYNWQAMDEL